MLCYPFIQYTQQMLIENLPCARFSAGDIMLKKAGKLSDLWAHILVRVEQEGEEEEEEKKTKK